MVLIITTPLEPSTDKVIDWLIYNGIDFYRLNGQDILTKKPSITIQFDIKDLIIKGQNQYTDDFRSLSSVWYRRDGIKKFNEIPYDEIKDKTFFLEVINTLNKEYLAGKKGLYSCISTKTKVLGNFNKTTPNKIEVLLIAKQAGFDIPATLITDSKLELESFLLVHKKLITKAIWESSSYSSIKTNTDSYTSYTEDITSENLCNISEVFFYSLFQEKLDKELDIRIFYLDKTVYSMAIFSQLHQQTSTDFRKYINNRNVPYKLPSFIENQVHNFMQEFGLNTGSIDVVKTKCGRYVFLEINPVGQFDMTSMPCNYHLDKKIASFLTLANNE